MIRKILLSAYEHWWIAEGSVVVVLPTEVYAVSQTPSFVLSSREC